MTKKPKARKSSDATVPAFIALLIPLFNRAGWYSGAGFNHVMHFEVSEERVREWANEGILRPPLVA